MKSTAGALFGGPPGYGRAKLALGVVVGLWSALLSTGMRRGEPLLGHDAFHYLSLTKQFAQALPGHLGNHYPFGYSVMASVVARLGLDPYLACVALAWLSWVAVCWFYFSLLDDEAHQSDPVVSLSLIVVIASAVGVYLLSTAAMSEMLFSLLVIAQIVLLSRVRSNIGVFLAMLLPVLVVGVRYAGVLILPAIGMWLVRQRACDPKSRYFSSAVAGLVVAVLACAALLWHNKLQTGHWTGGERVAGASALGDVVDHAAAMGWSFVAVFLGNVHAVVNQYPMLHIGIGLGLVLLIIGFCGFILMARSSSRAMAASASVVIAYLCGMIALRSISAFDSLASSRFAVPMLVPLGFLVAVTMGPRRRGLVLAAFMSIMVGGLHAGRGVSKATYAEDVALAGSMISTSAGPDAAVLASHQAARVAIYIDQEVAMLASPPACEDVDRFDMILVSSVARDRRGSVRSFDDTWLSFLGCNLVSRDFHEVERNESFVLLARNGS